jgi:hypothetical protein
MEADRRLAANQPPLVWRAAGCGGPRPSRKRVVNRPRNKAWDSAGESPSSRRHGMGMRHVHQDNRAVRTDPCEPYQPGLPREPPLRCQSRIEAL